ncbi:6-phosphofructokinase [Sporomusa acidovorans]|uniref:ATP-dependent 6-phosphofructokinase n=1 Tax=Sporomusa acidovorans (strain ATCC 49682 / DSM 3132 / Mol) TaxID=1123286 RepID=A0ABZ3IZD4_SPOA4|nr:6-phosphofructokinase [Sporomusa acidovorans]OZC22096.1 6-phosphofructokinase [Sporomusa acidovorans DSM 3132]SDF66345.1 6-phosphofructokinase [Sporomusa acidovorans]
MKKIAVITSGGDCPGMNAAIRAVVRVAMANQIEVWGIKNGYAGMIANDMTQLDSRSVGDIIHKGGTFLGTARSEEFKTLTGRQKAVANLQAHGIEGLVVIGGDGSLTGAKLLAELGIKFVGLPGTIDNDIWGTDYTIGFDTAVNTALDAINKLRDTASAHGRVMLVEVMGRACGWIALTAGLAGGAEIILIPEQPFSSENICRQLLESRAKGKQYSIVVVAEGAGSAIDLGKVISAKTGLETRVSVLGHIQRGGAPTVSDRLLASRLAERAVRDLLQGKSDIMIGYRNNQCVEVPITDAISKKKDIDPELYRLSDVLSQ